MSDVDDGVEIVDGPEPVQNEEEKVTLTKSELETLKQAAAGGGVTQSVAELVEALRKQPAPQVVVQQAQVPQAEPTQEDWETGFFTQGKSKQTLEALIDQKLAARIDPLVGAVAGELEGVHLGNFLRDERQGPIITKYKSEIDEFLKAVPPGQRALRSTLQLAVDTVMARHVFEIAEDYHQAKIKDGGAQAQQAQAQAKGQRQAPFMEGGGAAQAQAAANRGPRKVYITEADKREAERRGLDPARVAEYRARKEGKI